MSPPPNPRLVESADAMRAAFDEAFDEVAPDPLAAFDPAFRLVAADPFELFLIERVAPDSGGEYRLAIRQWNEHMAKAGRHPACPNRTHVREFARLRRERPGSTAEDAARALRLLGRAYRFWQHEPTLPHPDGYDPFERTRRALAADEDASARR